LTWYVLESLSLLLALIGRKNRVGECPLLSA
jgi:hypothetical protein